MAAKEDFPEKRAMMWSYGRDHSAWATAVVGVTQHRSEQSSVAFLAIITGSQKAPID